MEECVRRKRRRADVRREVWEVQDRSRRKDTKKRKLAQRNRVKSEKHLKETYGGLSEGVAMKTYLHDPMNFLKTLELRFSYRGPGPARKKKEVYQ